MDDRINLLNSALACIKQKIEDELHITDQLDIKRKKLSCLDFESNPQQEENLARGLGESSKKANYVRENHPQNALHLTSKDLFPHFFKSGSSSDCYGTSGGARKRKAPMTFEKHFVSWMEYQFGSQVISSWEEETLKEAVIGSFKGLQNNWLTANTQALLHSLWQRLHTGHWSDVPPELRLAYTWGSIALVGFLLQELKEKITKSGDNFSEEIVQSGALCIVQACDRGLLMGKPIVRNPLNIIANLLNGIAVKTNSLSEFNFNPTENLSGVTPNEALILEGMSPLETKKLPPINTFLLRYMEACRPLKILGVVDDWPALSTWNPAYFYKVGGARTVPVELGLRYSDSEWSQALMTLGDYLTKYLVSGVHSHTSSQNDPRAYLAQHQLFDQMPELLDDIRIPDYCHMGGREPVLNAWIGPEGTVTPLHYDPDHNILVQVYGYKAILLFPESDTKCLYPFEDALLSNTSRVNLEDEVKKDDPFHTFPLLREVKGQYLILGPGESLYIPPKWWHYVRSLSNSISVSFWWR